MRKLCSTPLSKRAIIAAYDALSVILVAACYCLLCAKPAWAYVDPSVMTYTIQALAGVAVALSAVLGVALRKTRKLILKQLKIDENAGKPIEPDVTIVTGKRTAETPYIIHGNRMNQQSQDSGEATQSTKSAFPKRLIVALIITAFFVITAFTSPALEIVWANEADLVFEFDDLLPVIFVASIIALLVLAAIVAVLPKKASYYVSSILFAIGLCMYIQAMFMNGGLPSANGATVNWGDYTTITLISSIVWVAVLAVAVVLAIKTPKPFRLATIALSAALIVVQGVGIISLLAQPEDTSPKYTLTERGINEIASDDNVIVIVLDTADTEYFKEVYRKRPELFDAFTGFTWYQNCTGMFIPTRYAIPYLLTGTDISHDECFQDYLARRYSSSTFLQDIKAAGYDIGVYTDTTGFEYIFDNEFKRGLIPLFTNFEKHSAEHMNRIGAVSPLLALSLYRDAPWVAKSLFRISTDDVNNALVSTDNDSQSSAAHPYTMNDAAYYRKLSTEKLTVSQTNQKCFRFIHLLGSHVPFILDENAQEVPESTLYAQTCGSVKILNEYITQLKQLGMYDSSTIIITADHGCYQWEDGPITSPCSPIMFIKNPGTADESAAPLAISQKAISQYDYPATVISAVGGDSSRYGTSINNLPDDPMRERYYHATVNGVVNGSACDVTILEYRIVGHVNSMNNWQLTGNTWSVWDNDDYPANQKVPH